MNQSERSLALTLGAGLLVTLAGTTLAGGSLDREIRDAARPFARFGRGCDECLRCRESGESLEPRGRIAFDEATGRRLANYPPRIPANIEHLKLDLSIEDMNRPSMSGVETLTLTPLGWALDELPLNARGMKITAVESPGRKASFEHDGEVLRIRLSPPPPPGETVTVVTRYQVSDPPAGLIWTPESKAWPGRPAQIHTQGQPQTNSYWFPCHDFPNERLTTELSVTVPTGFEVCSNGRLAERIRAVRTTRDKLGNSMMLPAETFRWVQDGSAGGDHVSYLVSMVVGKFDVVDVGSQGLPMPVYVPRGKGADVPGTFGKTPEIAGVLSSRISEDYPWSKYAQCVVWNFAAGGMENTSATTLYDTAVIAREAQGEFDQEGLISHELAHQWFGDLITCRSWEHVWLNEGFATYATALWAEKRPGAEGGAGAYQDYVRRFFDGIIANDRPEAPYAQPMVSKVYDHAWETFRRPANPYGKGASVLHMLRARLGDAVFFAGLAEYVDRFKHRDVETADFRKAMEHVSGESLEQFFAQWCYRPGVPTLKIETSYNAGSGEVSVDVEQVQNIDADNPAFEFTLPVWIEGATAGKGQWLKIPVAGRRAAGVANFGEEPRIIAVDPEMSVLAGMKIGLTAERWTAQLVSGPTYASRVQAARALGALGGAAGTRAGNAELYAIASDRAAFTGLRIEAARALAAMRDMDRVETLAAAQLTPPAVREAAVQALADAAASRDDAEWKKIRQRAESLLNDLAERDPSVRARAAAVSGLGKMRARDRAATAVQACRADSQDDVLRQAGLGALADMGAAELVDAATSLTREGVLNRTRARAAESLGRAAGPGRDAALKRLVQLLTDREVRVRGSARAALVDLGDARAIPELEKAAGILGDADRADAKACLRRLQERLTEGGAGTARGG